MYSIREISSTSILNFDRDESHMSTCTANNLKLREF